VRIGKRKKDITRRIFRELRRGSRRAAKTRKRGGQLQLSSGPKKVYYIKGRGDMLSQFENNCAAVCGVADEWAGEKIGRKQKKRRFFRRTVTRGNLHEYSGPCLPPVKMRDGSGSWDRRGKGYVHEHQSATSSGQIRFDVLHAGQGSGPQEPGTGLPANRGQNKRNSSGQRKLTGTADHSVEQGEGGMDWPGCHLTWVKRRDAKWLNLRPDGGGRVGLKYEENFYIGA